MPQLSKGFPEIPGSFAGSRSAEEDASAAGLSKGEAAGRVSDETEDSRREADPSW